MEIVIHIFSSAAKNHGLISIFLYKMKREIVFLDEEYYTEAMMKPP